MKFKALLFSLLLVGGLAVAKPVVVTSFPIIADITQNIGGDKVEVQSLIKIGQDPHSFEPKSKDAKLVKKANLVVVNGLGLEGWLDKFVKASGFQGKVVVASEGVKAIKAEEEEEHGHDDAHEHEHDHDHGNKHDHGHDHDHGEFDPHAWNAPQNGIIYVKNISKALAEIDPENKDFYQANAKQYIAELKAIDKQAKKKFGKISTKKRKVISEHDAFGYFAQAYKIKFIAPLGLSSEEEPTAGKVAKLIDQIKAEKIKYYFTEDSLKNDIVAQIAKATGAEQGGELYPETLSDAKGPAPTYLKALEYNINTIADALAK